jgi:NitT/TauT family transport system substrate-binding protein
MMVYQLTLTKLRVKNSYIPWSFLDIIAMEDGIFLSKGLQVEFFTVGRTSSEPADKVSWYSDLVRHGSLDAYSVCAWGAIDRLANADREKIIAASTSSGYAFSILVAPGLGIKTAADLVDTPIAVNMRTGSHYCVLSDLERVLPYDTIKVVHGGEPQSRLKGLLEGKFQAVALISPYTELAVKLGYIKVAETKTVDVLAFVARDDIPMRDLSLYLASLNEAASRLNSNPERYRDLYIRTLKETFSGYPARLKSRVLSVVNKISSEIPITTWGELTEYPRQSFDSLSLWMNKHNLLQSKVSYEDVVLEGPLQKVGAGAAESR